MKDIDILSKIDHTNLNNCSTWEDIKTTIDEAIIYQCASVCIMPYHVKQAVKYGGTRISIGAAIGFPRGDYTTEVKVFEAQQAIDHGAMEIDMVINLCEVKSGNYDAVLKDIEAVRDVCPGILKVIIETSELNQIEKIRLCEILCLSGANYIKTSTGFSKSGATIEDVELFKKHLKGGIKIKASGGIKTRQQAENLILAGASRIGTKFTKDFIS